MVLEEDNNNNDNQRFERNGSRDAGRQAGCKDRLGVLSLCRVFDPAITNDDIITEMRSFVSLSRCFATAHVAVCYVRFDRNRKKKYVALGRGRRGVSSHMVIEREGSNGAPNEAAADGQY